MRGHIEAKLVHSAGRRPYICQSRSYLEHHAFGFDPFPLVISEQKPFSQSVGFHIIGRNDDSNVQIRDEKGAEYDVGNEEESHVRLCFVAGNRVRPIAIHNRVHYYGPVHCLTHSNHLYHRVANIVEVVVVFAPVSTVVDAVSFRFYQFFLLLVSQSDYVFHIAKVTFSFEQINAYDSKNKYDQQHNHQKTCNSWNRDYQCLQAQLQVLVFGDDTQWAKQASHADYLEEG